MLTFLLCGGAGCRKKLSGTVELPVISAFEPGEVFETGVGQRVVSNGLAGHGIFDMGRNCGHGLVHHAGFGIPDSADAPAGGGHFLDCTCLDGVLRMEFIGNFVEEGIEFFLGLVFQYYALGIEAVGEVIAGRAQFSSFCFGTA